MKRIFTLCMMLVMLIGIGSNAKAALSVTVTWDTPGSVDTRAEIGASDWQEIAVSATATSQTFTLDNSWGSLKLWPAEGYIIESATTSGGETIKPSTYVKPVLFSFENSKPNGISFNLSSLNGQTIHLTLKKFERNTPFTINIVNGLSSITRAEFDSGYTLNLEQGSHTYYFNPEVDGKLDLRFAGRDLPYIITLNGEAPTDNKGDLNKYNTVLPYYSVTLKKDDDLKIQMFENADQELKEFDLSIVYGEGMEGCLSSIFNRTTSKMYTPDEYEGGVITGVKGLLEGAEIRLNLSNPDFTVTKVLVNGTDKSSDLSGTTGGDQSFLFTMTGNTTITLDGKATEWGDIEYTGYVSIPDAALFGLVYGTNPSEYTLVPTIGDDCSGKAIGETGLTMPEGSMKITLTVSEKNRNGQFFFMPKAGYYIKDFYCGTPLEQGSGSASMSYTYDGTVFYMIIEKLPEPYKADLSITGDDFFMRISANSSFADVWGNPGVGGYSVAEGEREISFTPGYGTPLVFAFTGDETKSPGVYLDGAEVAGVLNEESNAMEYTITPYYPESETDSKDIKSSIAVYNSYNDRPQMSGASLKLEEGGKAEFFYSPVMHTANPAGQVVISGTQFTVRPASAEDMIVLYKGKLVQLDANGEYVFNATGNARNNIVTVTTNKESAISSVADNTEDIVTVYSIDGKTLLENAPASRLGELEGGLYIVNGKKTIIK